MGVGLANDNIGGGGQSPGRYNVIYGQEYFKNLVDQKHYWGEIAAAIGPGENLRLSENSCP